MATETLRPDAAGDECNIEDEKSIACPNHYQEVDEAIVDDSGSYVNSGAVAWERDLYNVGASGIGAGIINFIKVYMRCAGSASHDQECAKIAIKSGTGEGAPDTVDEGSGVIPDPWTDYSHQWNTNPANEPNAWTWDEIDKLQIGVALREGKAATGWDTHCTQVYVEVEYVEVPTTTTQAISSIERTTATGNGNITDTGDENADKRGVCWNASGSPDVNDDTAEETDGFGTGAFTASMTGLSPGIKYYVKAYAHNSSGYSYGAEVTFITKAVLGAISRIVRLMPKRKLTEGLPPVLQQITGLHR